MPHKIHLANQHLWVIHLNIKIAILGATLYLWPLDMDGNSVKLKKTLGLHVVYTNSIYTVSEYYYYYNISLKQFWYQLCSIILQATIIITTNFWAYIIIYVRKRDNYLVYERKTKLMVASDNHVVQIHY